MTDTRRLHWLSGSATGDRVLDLGASRGLAALALAREGRTATVVEEPAAPLDELRAELERADPPLRDRVRIVAADGAGLILEGGAYDSVLLGGETAAMDPTAATADVARLLTPEGRLVVSVPWPAHPSEDRFVPHYLPALVGSLAQGFAIERVDLGDDYLGLVARKGATPDEAGEPGPWLDVLETAFRRLTSHERALEEHRRELADRDQALTRANSELDRASDRIERLEERLEKARESRDAALGRADELRGALAGAQAELAAARQDVEEQRRRLTAIRASRSFRLVRLLWAGSGLIRRARGDASRTLEGPEGGRS